MAQEKLSLGIEIAGWQSFSRDLRRMSKETRKATTEALRSVLEPATRDAQRRYRRLHPRGPRSSKEAQRGIRSFVNTSAGGWRMGSPGRYPMLGGQEWGSDSGRYPMFPGRSKDGRFFWPAVVDGAESAADKLERKLSRIMRRVFRD